ncbi:MAG: hypothetical protein QGG50_00610 [Methanopyri archaeon]|nr:hypothetical protein [Methanopyri archaeon]
MGDDQPLSHTNRLLIVLLVSVAIVILFTPHIPAPRTPVGATAGVVTVAARYSGGGPAASALVTVAALQCASRSDVGAARTDIGETTPPPALEGPTTSAFTDIDGIARVALDRTFYEAACGSLRVDVFRAERRGTERDPNSAGWWAVDVVSPYRTSREHSVSLDLVSTRFRARPAR